MMLADPSKKYRRMYQRVDLPDRQWPNNEINQAPIWMSTDLRDGNQAIFEPMNMDQKFKMFQMLVKIGFKHIEIGFPSASQIDFDFTRKLIEENHIPDDVYIEVLVQARDHLIQRTFEALQGAKRAIVHIYNSNSPTFRKKVLNVDVAGAKQLAINAAEKVKEYAAKCPETEWIFQYSPECFSATELEVAKDVCDAVTEIWEASPENKVILNLPATVEVSGPNVYADQIEWMHRNIARRDGVIISVHCHNDRGCGIAASELAIMAGADRVEGCVFGNGERTGNVDLVTNSVRSEWATSGRGQLAKPNRPARHLGIERCQAGVSRPVERLVVDLERFFQPLFRVLAQRQCAEAAACAGFARNDDAFPDQRLGRAGVTFDDCARLFGECLIAIRLFLFRRVVLDLCPFRLNRCDELFGRRGEQCVGDEAEDESSGGCAEGLTIQLHAMSFLGEHSVGISG